MSLRVDSIGAALDTRNEALTGHLAEFTSASKQLNEISNAFKHSFINTDLNYCGRDEPIVFAPAAAADERRAGRARVNIEFAARG